MGTVCHSGTLNIYMTCKRYGNSARQQGFWLHCARPSSSGMVYETQKITNKLLDADTLYLLDKYSR